MQQEKQLSFHLNKLAQFCIINQLCQIQTNQQIDSQKIKQNLNIGSFISPFYMGLFNESSQQQNKQIKLGSCLNYSKKSDDLNYLLKSVIQMPKLRYKQSEKSFPNLQIQQQKKKYKNSCKNNNKESFQTPQSLKNISTIKKKQFQSSFINKSQQSTGQKLTFEEINKKKQQNRNKQGCEQESLQEQIDIGKNMSDRSGYWENIVNQRDINNQSHVGNERREDRFLKRNSNKHQEKSHFYNESQSKVNIEKNFVQNYFSAAKTKIFQDFSLNCCQGLISSGQNTKINQKQSKSRINEQKTIKQQKKQRKSFW